MSARKKRCDFCGSHVKKGYGTKFGSFCSENHATQHAIRIAEDWIKRKGSHEKLQTEKQR